MSTKAKTILWYTPEAYYKMRYLIRLYNKEVGWKGVVEKTEDNNFLVKDILVYPQYTSSGLVDTDDLEYRDWLYGLDVDTFNKLKLCGHSHVNMNCMPSATDKKQIADLIPQIKDCFYVYTIFNKHREFWGVIFEEKNGHMKRTAIDAVSIYLPPSFREDAKNMVQPLAKLKEKQFESY